MRKGGKMSDQVLVTVISALGSALVAWITAHENNRQKMDKLEKKSELEKLQEENTRLKEELERKNCDESSK